jgi:anaerobic selenocysteine-containing dehydrogenase
MADQAIGFPRDRPAPRQLAGRPRAAHLRQDGRPIAVEGDLRGPVNQGTLCPRVAATTPQRASPSRTATR